MTVRTPPSPLNGALHTSVLREDRGDAREEEWTAPDLPPAGRVALVAAGLAALVFLSGWVAQLL